MKQVNRAIGAGLAIDSKLTLSETNRDFLVARQY
jgi:hypothetical protein